MCFGGGSVPHDNSAQVAADQEAKRQANITAGTAAVNNAFDSAFNDNYYNNVATGYENYYNPQLDQQYQNTLNSLTAQLGQQGILQSSEGNRQIALLKQSYDTNKQTVANNALNAENTIKQNIDGQKNQLLSQAQQAGDPSNLAAQAAETVSSNSQPAIQYSPLGSVFAGALGQGTNALSIQQGGVPAASSGNGGGFITNIWGGNNGSSNSGHGGVVP